MARSMITIEGDGLTNWIDELEKGHDLLPELMLEALKARQEVIEDAIRTQWVTMGGTTNGFVYSSIGQSSAFSKENPDDVVGTIGVYDIDSVKNSFGKTEKDLNAAQIAYWVENGTSRLRSGGRKKNNLQYPDEMLVQVQAKPFISNAVYSSWSDAEAAFIKTFNSEYERLVK